MEKLRPVGGQIEMRRIQRQQGNGVLPDQRNSECAGNGNNDLGHLALLADGDDLAFVTPPVEQEGEEGRKNDQIDHRVLGRHQTQEFQGRMILAAAHFADLLTGQGQVMRR